MTQGEEASLETRGTVGTSEEDADALACPLRLLLMRRFEKYGEEAGYFLPEEFPGQIAYPAELRHLALHVRVAPLEMPAVKSGEVVAAPPSIAHERHDAMPHRRRQAAEHRLPIASSLFTRTEYEEGGEGVRACEGAEKYHETAVPAGRPPERKPESVGNRDEGNVRGDVMRGMALEQAPEALMESLAEYLAVFTAAFGEAAEGEGTAEDGAGKGNAYPFRSPAPPPRTHRPRGAARGAPPPPDSVGARRRAATM